jgi:hypothetical protein
MIDLNYSIESNYPRQPNVDEMREFVRKKSKFKLTTEQFELIEETFRVKWNSSTGKIVGDEDFKKYVYEVLRNEKNIFVMQQSVEDVVDLILIYMEECGQYFGDSLEN